MTATPTFRDRIAELELLARAQGEGDFAEFLNSYRIALGEELWNGDECLFYAADLPVFADKLYQRFDRAAAWLNERGDVA